jgi:hypothetical protein
MAVCFGLAGRVFQSQSAGKVASVIPIEFEKVVHTSGKCTVLLPDTVEPDQQISWSMRS